ETVFFVPATTKGVDYDIRWFTPSVEINLCGHATLASAYVLYEILGFSKPEIVFNCKSGLLKVTKTSNEKEVFKASMDFPSWKPEKVDSYPDELSNILGGAEIVAVYKSRDWLVELNDEDAVKKCNPDFGLMKKHFDK